MHRIIYVTVRSKIATVSKTVLYVCGNSDFTVRFDFDEEWMGHNVKTARFAYNGTYKDVVFEGNECPVPVISDTHSFRVGVFSGNLKTTTAAYVSAKKSILCGSGSPAAPSPDVYAQIMDKLNEIAANGVTSDQIEEALAKYLEKNPIDGINEDELKQAVEAALEEAKASGVFKGDPGEPGVPGNDYVLTDEDKREIAERAAGLVEVPDGPTVELDTTLKVPGKAADAGAVGDALTQLNEKNAAQDEEIAKKANDSDLAAVAKSGSYNDLKDKPEIGESAPEVYIGAEKPTDPNVTVWIDPDREPSSSGGAEQESVFELIESFTLQDGEMAFARTAEPDGTPYNFRAMLIQGDIPEATATVNVKTYYKIGEESVYTYFGQMQSILYTAKRVQWYERIYPSYGYYMTDNYTPYYAYDSSYNALFISPRRINAKKAEKNITGIKFELYNSSISFPAGSAINIWGVRANA